MTGSAACGATAEALPSTAAEARLPALTGRVVDNAHLLSRAAKAELIVKLAALESATTDQFVVTSVTSLGGRPIEAFGLALGNAWKIGQSGIDNGVLLIVAPAERKVRIEVGLGLERVLTDARASKIMQEVILPYFRRGDMEGGIVAGVNSIITALRSSPERTQCKVSS